MHQATDIKNFRSEIEKIADQMCFAVQGAFDFSIQATTQDEIIQKLCMLMNFTIDAARRSIEINAENTKLTELDKLKSNFMANVSHELRTPLTLILGPLDKLLSNKGINPDQKESLLRIQRNAFRLYELVNNLLDFTKLEAGKFILNEESIDINQLISYIVEDAQGLAEERHLNLTFTPCNEIPLMMLDRKMIDKIILNLISNALKFTPAGGQVNVQLSKNDNFASIIVKDTGVGIPVSKLPKLFERFYQVDSSIMRAHEGTGIGLAIIKQFVEMMDGSINVKSQEGKGSTFNVLLPIKTNYNKIIENQSNLENQNIKPIRTSLSKSKIGENPYENENLNNKNDHPLILIADDNKDVRFYLISILKDDYNIIQAENGKTALEEIYKHNPDLVLSDIMMPEMNGLELTSKIKSDVTINHIPIILITAKAGKEAVFEGFEVGADDYLSKPFSTEELRARINATLKVRRGNIKIEKLNNDLVIAARYAGMADVAASVMHNIGNALNTVSTSSTLISQKITSSKVSNIIDLANLLHQHEDNMADFITNDPQGKRIPNYILKLAETLKEDKKFLLDEANVIKKGIFHIKEIISKQNSLSKSLGGNDEIIIQDLIEDAILLNRASYANTNIEIIRDFDPLPKILNDHVKLLQIFVNLIKNSVESVIEQNPDHKKIILSIKEKNASFFTIKLNDNGIGITEENLKKIFSFGFTTKKKGHGFGLHSSTISIQDMGGNLSVESDGLGKGATFTITLPYQPSKKEDHKNE